MIKVILLGSICFALTGCAAHDQRMATNFLPLDNGNWRYQAFADVAQPLHSASAEQYRMSMLEIWLGENDLCPNGYTVTNRQAIKRSSGAIGDIYDVYYEGSCA